MDMKAGRGLDALIAEKVMGWCIDPGLPDETAFLYPPEWNNMLGAWPSTRGRQQESTYDLVPHYSTNIADAWKVLKHLSRTRSLSYDIISHADPKGNYIVTFWNRNMSENEITPYECVVRGEVGDELPLVICLAALEAVKHKESDG